MVVMRLFFSLQHASSCTPPPTAATWACLVDRRRAATAAVDRCSSIDFVVQDLQSIAWESIGDGDGPVVLRNAAGGYLRANGRIRRWNTGVSVENCSPADLTNMASWVVETIPLPVVVVSTVPVRIVSPKFFLSGSEH